MNNLFNIQCFSVVSSWATCKGKYANSGQVSQNPSGGTFFVAFCLKSKQKRENFMALIFNKNPSKSRLPSNLPGISNQALKQKGQTTQQCLTYYQADLDGLNDQSSSPFWPRLTRFSIRCSTRSLTFSRRFAIVLRCSSFSVL